MKQKLLLIAGVVFFQTYVYASNCIDVMKQTEEKSKGVDIVDISVVKQFYTAEIVPKMLFHLEKERQSGHFQNGKFPFKLSWKFDSNGKVLASCECEDILEVSNSLSSAKEVLAAMRSFTKTINASSATYASELSKIPKLDTGKNKITISPRLRNIDFCATGTIMGTKGDGTTPHMEYKTNKSQTTTH